MFCFDQSISRLGRRRPRRNLAHRRRWRNLASAIIANVSCNLSAVFFRRRPPAVGPLAANAGQHQRHPRRRTPHRRRRQRVDPTAPPRSAEARRRKILRPRSWHRLRPIRVLLTLGRLFHARRRQHLAAAPLRRLRQLARRRLSRPRPWRGRGPGGPNRHALAPQKSFSRRWLLRRYAFVPRDAARRPNRRLGRRRRRPIDDNQRPRPQLANAADRSACVRVADHFDFHAVAVVGPHVWVAGSPGTRIFHSADAGETWQSIATGQSAASRACTSSTPSTVGPPAPSATSWQHTTAAKPGNRNAPAPSAPRCSQSSPTPPMSPSNCSPIAAPPTATSPPSTSFAHRPTNARIPRTRRARSRREKAAPRRRAPPTPPGDSPARRRPGATPPPTCCRRPSTAKTTAAPCNKSKATSSASCACGGPMSSSRTMSHPSADASINALIEQLVLHAVEAAADPARYPELANDVGLAPWPVKKVYGVLPLGERGDELFAAGRFSPWLGAALGDFFAPPPAPCCSRTHTAPRYLRITKLLNTLPQTVKPAASSAASRSLLSPEAPPPASRFAHARSGCPPPTRDPTATSAGTHGAHRRQRRLGRSGLDHD